MVFWYRGQHGHARRIPFLGENAQVLIQTQERRAERTKTRSIRLRMTNLQTSRLPSGQVLVAPNNIWYFTLIIESQEPALDGDLFATRMA